MCCRTDLRRASFSLGLPRAAVPGGILAPLGIGAEEGKGSPRDAGRVWGGVAEWSARSVAAALHPAPRDQDSRRGRGRLMALAEVVGAPASCALLPLRDGLRWAGLIRWLSFPPVPRMEGTGGNFFGGGVRMREMSVGGEGF